MFLSNLAMLQILDRLNSMYNAYSINAGDFQTPLSYTLVRGEYLKCIKIYQGNISVLKFAHFPMCICKVSTKTQGSLLSRYHYLQRITSFLWKSRFLTLQFYMNCTKTLNKMTLFIIPVPELIRFPEMTYNYLILSKKA